jgi:hypothetical protein
LREDLPVLRHRFRLLDRPSKRGDRRGEARCTVDSGPVERACGGILLSFRAYDDSRQRSGSGEPGAAHKGGAWKMVPSRGWAVPARWQAGAGAVSARVPAHADEARPRALSCGRGRG